MTSKSKQTTVIAGEASESDDDESVVNNVASSPEVTAGEAVESEDEDQQEQLPPLQVDQTTEGDKVEEVSPDTPSPDPVVADEAIKVEPPKYDTLLHKKLRERNASLYKNLGDYMSGKYMKNTKDIKEITKSLAKSQTVIQDVSHELRMLTNDLFQLEDRISLVTTSDILPVIDLHKPQA